MRSGSVAAFGALSAKFGEELFDSVPKLWESVTQGLLAIYPCHETGTVDVLAGDAMASETPELGQAILDTLATLREMLPTLHPSLRRRFDEQFLKSLTAALGSEFSVIRQAAAKCFAIFCDVETERGMLFAIKNLVRYHHNENQYVRLGGVEFTFRRPLYLPYVNLHANSLTDCMNVMQAKMLPYVVFFVVPLLSSMSEHSEDCRLAATNAFATIVKMVPLEVSSVEPFVACSVSQTQPRLDCQIHRTSLKDLSTSGRRSVLSSRSSWMGQKWNPIRSLSRLTPSSEDTNRTVLIGYISSPNISCMVSSVMVSGIMNLDLWRCLASSSDMGLGKTLQSICVLSSIHHERSKSNLPSLIVCPPTLTNHWYHEIKKYATNLRPLMYTGNVKERRAKLKKFTKFNILITSYDVLRNDIGDLTGAAKQFIYCILDEGHIIKNGKTKVSQAVKRIKADHRLILSGTPIQNNLLELWSLFDFLMPGFLGSEQSFNERFAKPVLASKEGKGGMKAAESGE
jgi:TATA-binding protein-associated factor